MKYHTKTTESTRISLTIFKGNHKNVIFCFYRNTGFTKILNESNHVPTYICYSLMFPIEQMLSGKPEKTRHLVFWCFFFFSIWLCKKINYPPDIHWSFPRPETTQSRSNTNTLITFAKHGWLAVTEGAMNSSLHLKISSCQFVILSSSKRGLHSRTMIRSTVQPWMAKKNKEGLGAAWPN